MELKLQILMSLKKPDRIRQLLPTSKQKQHRWTHTERTAPTLTRVTTDVSLLQEGDEAAFSAPGLLDAVKGRGAMR